MPNDQILIEELELTARIGVPDAERAEPQRLTVSLVLEPKNDFRDLADDLTRTVDYAQVCAEVQTFVSGRQDKLLETLAHEMAEHLLAKFALRQVRARAAQIHPARDALRRGADRALEDASLCEARGLGSIGLKVPLRSQPRFAERNVYSAVGDQQQIRFSRRHP